jgi:ATP-dependent DNA helicase RecQ
MQSVLEGRDTLAVMPTGSGKSAIYEVGGLHLEGPTIVVSPLIALQRDQVDGLRERGVAAAAVVNSTLGRGQRREALADVQEGEVEFLFLAPEQFGSEDVLRELRAARPSLFVVDEAHCISDWGHDFRPDYLRLGAVVEALGRPTVLALTATAAPRVREEIVERLGMRNPRVVVRGFDRPSLRLAVLPFDREAAKTAALLRHVAAADKPGIVYVATRRQAEDVASALVESGVQADAYHAGMRPADRETVQARFMDDRSEVIVATSAFGMGIDKPDVRFVHHHHVSESLDAYY